MSEIDIERLKVDPSLWPDRATHYSSINGIFYKVEDGKVYLKACGTWLASMHDACVFVEYPDVIPHPTKQEEPLPWEGGLPPVGTICEYQLKHDEPHDEWSKCVIEFVGDRYVVTKCWPDETMSELEQCFMKRDVKFRPLKSKHERQREELASTIFETGYVGEAFKDVVADAVLSRFTLESKP